MIQILITLHYTHNVVYKNINSDVSCDQLNKCIYNKHSELVNSKDAVFHHDNAKPRITLQSRQKLLFSLGCVTSCNILTRH